MSVGPDTRSSQPSLRHRLTEIRVIGVGVGGSNAVNHMFFTPMRDVHVSYAILNTDAAHLAMSAVPTRLTIGERLTRGLGAGGNPAIGRASAEESRDALRDLLRGADLVFIAAGMGGGTGTGGAPVVAQIAREVGALSIGIVTTPFAFGGRPRATVAERGLRELAHHADNVVVVDNDRILDTKRNLPARKAFRMADEILRLGVQSVAELVAVPGDIIVDFDDLRGVMLADRWAALGTGSGGGPNGLMQATRSALNSPLLSGHIGAARGILVNFRTRAQAAVPEVREASEAVRAAVAPNCNVITALITEAGMQVGAEVTIIAVGIRPFGFEDADNAPPPAEVAALLEMVDRLEEALGAYERRDAGSPAKSVLNGALDSAIGYVEASTRITLTKKVVVGRAKVRQVLDALRPAARAKPALAGDAMDPMLAGLLGELRRRAQALAEPRRTPSMAGD